jgi:hypothetical protein
MRDYVELGPTPCNEDCAQVGKEDYQHRARKECETYVRQLWRILKEKKGIEPDEAPESFNIVIRSHPHDFGSYKEVAACYSEGNNAAMELAYFLEEYGPTEWDDEARKELGLSE